jgi:hypothetical protein
VDEQSNLIGFRVDNLETVSVLKTIAKREGKQIKEIFNAALIEYADKHGPGNFQTILGSYQPGGVKSDGQIEQTIISELTKKYLSRDIHFREVLSVCQDYGFKKDAVESGNRISKKLTSEGWKVWK